MAVVLSIFIVWFIENYFTQPTAHPIADDPLVANNGEHLAVPLAYPIVQPKVKLIAIQSDFITVAILAPLACPPLGLHKGLALLGLALGLHRE